MPELTEQTLAGESTGVPAAQPSPGSPPARGRRGREQNREEAAAATPPAPATAEASASGEFEDVDIPGRGAPPPAHGGWEAPPPTPAVWSLPTGAIAGHDSATRNRPLDVPLSPSLGKEGKRRRPAAVIALSVVTLGVYALIWHHRVNVEVADFDTRMYVRAARSTLAVALVWAAGLLVSIAGAVLVVATQMHVTLPYDPPLTLLERYLLLGGLVMVPYLILALPFSVIAMVMTLERVRIAEDRVGRTTDMQIRAVASVWWLAVPVAGGLVLQSLVQRRLNRVWEAVAPAARISEY
jgi:hypothetical protein